MPLPFLIPVAIGAAGIFGAVKAGVAVKDMSDAKDIASDAQSIARYAENKLENAKSSTNNILSAYGYKKVTAYERDVSKFLELIQQIKNVEFSDCEDFNLKLGDFKAVVGDLKHSCEALSNTAISVGSGAASGALVAFGAYNGTMLLASAGTGTAISSLSGAAATNATLAWLGGGTLASGGLGVAGGTLVLGTLVVGPALLIFGCVLGAKASKALDDARANREQARTYEKEIDVICQKLSQIDVVVNLASETLSKIRARCRRANNKMAEVIENAGTDWNTYDDTSQKSVFIAYKYMQLLKTLLDTSILNESGALTEGVEQQICQLQNKLT